MSPQANVDTNNYIKFKVNGADRMYTGKDNPKNSTGVNYSTLDEFTIISGIDGKRQNRIKIITILIADSIKVDSIYKLDPLNGIGEASYYDWAASSTNGNYSTSPYGRGWIKFSEIDQTVAAGSFDFTAYYPDTINVTDGHFRIAR